MTSKIDNYPKLPFEHPLKKSLAIYGERMGVLLVVIIVNLSLLSFITLYTGNSIFLIIAEGKYSSFVGIESYVSNSLLLWIILFPIFWRLRRLWDLDYIKIPALTIFRYKYVVSGIRFLAIVSLSLNFLGSMYAESNGAKYGTVLVIASLMAPNILLTLIGIKRKTGENSIKLLNKKNASD